MHDDRGQLPLNAEYEQEQAATRAYMNLVERRLAELVDRHLTHDVEAVLESGGANRALKKAIADLLKSGELDETVRRELRAVLARNDRQSTPPRRWSWPSLLLGSVATLLVVLGAPWAAGVFSDPRESLPGGDPVGPGAETNGGTVQPSAEDPPGPVVADDYIRIFDERFGVDRAWSRPLWTELALRGTRAVPQHVERWSNGEDFDTAKIRRAMALLILQDQGLGGLIDGEYEPGCNPNNCIIVRNEWIRLWELGEERSPPIPSEGDTWMSDPETLEPFEKFIVAQYLEGLTPNG